MSRRLALLEKIIARRRIVVALTALAATAAGLGLPRLESDNSAAIYAPQGTAEAAAYTRFVSSFGDDAVTRIVVAGEALWSEPGLAELARLERTAAALEGVRAASSLLGRHPDAAGDAAAVGGAALADPLDRGFGWIGAGGDAASVLLELDPLSSAAYARLEQRLGELAATAAAGLEVTVVGSRSLELALNRSAREIETVFFPLLILFALALLAATFRDFGGVAVPLAFVAVSEVATLGLMGWCGVRFHLVLAVLPPLLFVIALATAVHLLVRCRALEADGLGARAATLATYRDKGRAILFTSISTAAGFAALGVSPVGPVRTLGLWAAVGLALQLVTAFTLLPALLAGTAGRRQRLPERTLEQRLERWGRRVAERSIRSRVVILSAALALALVAGIGIDRLGVESNVASYFPSAHAVRRALEVSERAGIGLSTVELVLRSTGGEQLTEPATLESMAELGAALREIAGVLSLAGPVELLDAIGAESPWAALAPPAELRAQALAMLADDSSTGSRALARFVADAGRTARISLFVVTGGFESTDRIATAAVTAAARTLPGVEASATGTLPLLVSFHRSLITTLDLSLALLVPLLFAVFLRLLRRPLDALLALVPNLLPVALLLGGMGWLGVRLDLATVMVASIVLGLAADDTIHTLARFRTESQRVGRREAVVGRLAAITPAYLLTGAILVAGFGVCALSSFVPIARFGGLAAAAIALAVVCDLIVVPALFGSGDAGAR